MSRESHQRRRQRSSDLGNALSSAQSSKTLHLLGSLPNPSQPYSSGRHSGSGPGPEESGKLASFTAEATVDHTRVTMTTRVAVRDKTPHRFQVVPLRDVSKLVPSAALAENIPRLGVSATPKHDMLNSPSGMFDPHSQARPLHSSTSRQSHLDNLSGESGKVELELNANGAPPATSEGKIHVTSHSRDDIPSLGIPEKSTILGEWDMNRERQRPLARSTRQTRNSSTVSNLSSSDSIRKLIQSESPLTHTISRSLQVRTPQDANYPKPTRPSHFQPPEKEISQPSSFPDLKRRHCRTVSDACPRGPENPVSERDSYHTLFDAYNMDCKSTKRHAIYTPSLYVPSFEHPGQFQGLEISSSVHSNWEPSPYFGPSCSGQDEQPAKGDTSFEIESQTIVHHEIRERDFGIRDDDISRFSLEDPFEIRTTGSMDCLPVEKTSSHHLTHMSSSRSLRLHIPHGLNYSKPPHKQGPSRTGDKLRSGEIVYPQIVLSLSADIDKAIEEWNSGL
ncbi:hypothetical protein BDZ97DRAFT_1911574 [Flammula alnicola]|nr:hypothetical protein BDZ97DRAFT_1911574 [Flammula alnicola]